STPSRTAPSARRATTAMPDWVSTGPATGATTSVVYAGGRDDPRAASAEALANTSRGPMTSTALAPGKATIATWRACGGGRPGGGGGAGGWGEGGNHRGPAGGLQGHRALGSCQNALRLVAGAGRVVALFPHAQALVEHGHPGEADLHELAGQLAGLGVGTG